MKHCIFPSLLLLLLSSTAVAQRSTLDAGLASMESMFGSMTAGSGGKEVSLTDSIDQMMQSLSDAGPVENTEESVQTAITGPLVVEEAIPETNREVVEAIDRKTNRYSPRLKLDFKDFPLMRPTATVGTSIPVERLIKHLQFRLRLDTPIALEFQDRTACLHGTVATEQQRELAGLILRLEPGVDTVKNELVVGK